MLRVLKPGGKIAAIVYSTPVKNKFSPFWFPSFETGGKLQPPLPGQPGPFSLGAEGVIEKAFTDAGYINVTSALLDSPLQLSSAKEEPVWQKIETPLRVFESANGFTGPCEMLVAVGEEPA